MWQSLLVNNACPQPQTEETVLVSPSLILIDTFGKWCRCLHNVCYVKLKKRRYLDQCRDYLHRLAALLRGLPRLSSPESFQTW